MTTTEDLGKFTTKIKRTFFGTMTKDVTFDVISISTGKYQLEGRFPKTICPYEKEEDYGWIRFSFSPEQMKKSIELFPSAVKQTREKAYIPFYQDYQTDRGMFDFGWDTLFQAYKDSLFEDWIVMANTHFQHGIPEHVSHLNIQFSELIKLKEYLDTQPKIFYQGIVFDDNGDIASIDIRIKDETD